MSDDRAQHRTEIQFSVMCKDCGRNRAYYSPVAEHVKLEAYCPECKAKRAAEIRRKWKKDFLAAERWLIDPKNFQRKKL